MAKAKGSKDLDALKDAFHTGDYVKFELKDVILEYPHLHEPDTRFDAVGKYKVNCIIPDDVASDMEYIGFNVKVNDDGQKYVIVQRKPHLGQPKVTQDGNAVDTRKIGNGSIANVEVSARSVTVAGRTHLPIYIEEIKIDDLVVYEGAGGSTSVKLM